MLPSCTVDGLNIIRDITESLVEIPKETSDTLHLEILRFCYELDNDNQKELQIIDMLLTKNPNDWLALCRKIEITKDRDCIRDIVTQYQDSTFDRIESQNDKANSKGLESQILLYTAAKALFDSQQSISPITNLEDCYISLVCLQKALEFPEQHEMLDIGGFFKTLARDNDNTIFSYYLGSKNICRYRLAPSHAEIYLEIASILLPISLVCEDKEIAEEARQNFEKAKKFVKLMQDKNKQDLMQEEIDSFNTALLYMVLEDFKKAKDSLTTAQDEGENIILKMILDIYDCIRQKDSKRLRDSIEILCEAIRKYNKHIDSAKHKLSEMPEIADKFLQVQEILGQELKIQQTIGMLIERNKEQTTDICGILLSNCIIPKLCAHGHMTEALYILCVAEMYNFASLSLIPAYLQIGEYDRCLELIEKEIPLESSEQSNHKEYKQKQLLKYKLIAYMHLKQNREIKKILKEEMQKDGKWAIEMYLVLLQQRLLQLEIIALQSQDSKQDNEQINKKNCEKEYTQHVEILRHKARIYQFDSKLHAFCRQLNPAITIKEGVKDNIRLPRPVAHIREIHQQRKWQREIRQHIVTERQVLESVRVLPVQFPNREGEHRCHKEKITVLIPPVIVQETRRKQQHPAHEAHRAVHPHLQPFCQPGKLQYPQHVNDKKKGKETQRVHEDTRRQDDDEQQTADSPFHEITQHVPNL